jgi:hypothetical protein
MPPLPPVISTVLPAIHWEWARSMGQALALPKVVSTIGIARAVVCSEDAGETENPDNQPTPKQLQRPPGIVWSELRLNPSSSSTDPHRMTEYPIKPQTPRIQRNQLRLVERVAQHDTSDTNREHAEGSIQLRLHEHGAGACRGRGLRFQILVREWYLKQDQRAITPTNGVHDPRTEADGDALTNRFKTGNIRSRERRLPRRRASRTSSDRQQHLVRGKNRKGRMYQSGLMRMFPPTPTTIPRR